MVVEIDPINRIYSRVDDLGLSREADLAPCYIVRCRFPCRNREKHLPRVL